LRKRSRAEQPPGDGVNRNEQALKQLISIITVSIITAALCVLSATAAHADTGTYVLDEYRVKLTPKSSGAVRIEYYQKWQVTGGHIPWITVGTANQLFDIVPTSASGAAKQIRPDSSGGWAGVRIDLDRDYQPGQSFEVGFSIDQHRLFYAAENAYVLEFTPGWYDRARIRLLQVEIFFFAKIENVKTGSPATRVDGQTMIWEKRDLAPGQRFTVKVTIPQAGFRGAITSNELKASPRTGFGLSGIVLLIVSNQFLFILAIIVIAILLSVVKGMLFGYSHGGTIFTSGGGGRSDRHTGGGGGFGGRSSSCACACVSCACACACAGGGGAGCDRKTRHSCPLCRDCRRESCLIKASTQGLRPAQGQG